MDPIKKEVAEATSKLESLKSEIISAEEKVKNLKLQYIKKIGHRLEEMEPIFKDICIRRFFESIGKQISRDWTSMKNPDTLSKVDPCFRKVVIVGKDNSGVKYFWDFLDCSICRSHDNTFEPINHDAFAVENFFNRFSDKGLESLMKKNAENIKISAFRLNIGGLKNIFLYSFIRGIKLEYSMLLKYRIPISFSEAEFLNEKKIAVREHILSVYKEAKRRVISHESFFDYIDNEFGYKREDYSEDLRRDIINDECISLLLGEDLISKKK